MWFVCLIIYNLEVNKYLIGPFTTLIFKKLSRWFYPLLFIAKIDKKRRGVTSVLTLGIGREREQWHSLKQNKKQKTVSGNPQENPRIYICQHKRSCMRHSHQKFQRWTSPHPPCLQTLSQQPLGSCTCKTFSFWTTRAKPGKTNWELFSRAGDAQCPAGCSAAQQEQLDDNGVCLCVCGWMDWIHGWLHVYIGRVGGRRASLPLSGGRRG